MAREDLLRIDSTGTAHPLGRDASAALREKSGEWRVLITPSEVLLAVPAGPRRYVRWAGELHTPGALSDVVTLAAQSGWRGELVLTTEYGVRSIFFDGGNVLAVLTSVAAERLGELMFRFGVVPSREDLDAILAACEESGKRLGEMAIELGLVTAEALYPMMHRQVEEVVFGALHAGEGAFVFFEGFVESRIEDRRFSLNAGGLLMEAARRMDELQFFREKVPNGRYIPHVVPGHKAIPEELAKVFQAIDGKRNIEEIGIVRGTMEFELTKTVYQLVSGGYVKLVQPKPVGASAIIEVINPAIIMVHTACDSAKKGAELRSGLGRFATGAGVYDPLFTEAGPAQNGSFKGDRIAKNLAAIAGAEEDAFLLQLLGDYVGFALFQAESLLEREVHRALSASVNAILAPLMPNTEASPNGSKRPSMISLDGVSTGMFATDPPPVLDDW
jgi:Domain of unknown function (DUF4388)